MSLASIPFIFSAGQTIIASQHNSNFSTIYNVVNGGLDNSNIAAGAGIVYTKLYLAGQLVNTDISPTAAIDGSKLANSGIDLTTKVTGILPIANGGTGSATASLVGGTNISISGTFPNQTVNGTSYMPTYTADSSAVIASALTSEATSSNSYAILKDITLFGQGTLYFTFTLQTLNISYPAYAKIYRNGSPVGTEKIAVGTQPQNDTISGWSNGDHIQLYVHGTSNQGASITNFIVYGTQCTINTN